MAESVIYVNDKKRRSRVEVFALGPNRTILAACKGDGILPFMPGGGIDDNETVERAGARELEEETGWLAENHKEFVLPGNWVFSGPTDPWFDENHWDEEEHYSIFCNAVRFQPTARYGSEGDSDVFTLVPMRQVVNETKSALPSLNPRLRFMAEFRLTVLEKLLNRVERNYHVEKYAAPKPHYVRW